MTSAWEGNPDKRIYARVKERGYSSVKNFAEERATKSYIELAEELGEDVAGIQIEAVLADEYQDANELVRFIKSNFVRSIWKNFPNGWDIDENPTLKRAYIYGKVSSSFTEIIQNKIEKGWNNLVKSPNLYKGWLPQNADDPILTEAFKEIE